MIMAMMYKHADVAKILLELKLKSTDASFNGIRKNLISQEAIKEIYKSEFNSSSQEDSGALLIKVATDCILILDRVMYVIWQKLATQKLKKPKIYFPVYESEDKFKSNLKKYRIENIDKSNPDLFRIIREVQPFCCENSWLFKQYHIAKERHSDSSRIYETVSKSKGMRIGFNFQKGEAVSVSFAQGDRRQHFHTESWGVPDRAPPKFIIKDQREAISFFDECFEGTAALTNSIIECFDEYRLMLDF